MMIMVSIINQSVMLRGRNFEPILSALAKQVYRDLAPVYGETPGLELATESTFTGDAAIIIQDKPDIDGALGYHSETLEGMVYGRVFVEPIISNGGSLQDGPNSVSCTLSHELLEMIGDEYCNKWADGPMGEYAHELCDAVQSNSYDIDGVSVSNFVYPRFFDTYAPSDSKLDHLGLLSKPFEMTDGGYQILRNEGDVSHIYGKDFPEWKQYLKSQSKRFQRRTLEVSGRISASVKDF